MITASKKIKSTNTFVIDGEYEYEEHHAELTIRELDMPVVVDNSKYIYAVGIEIYSKENERREYVESPTLCISFTGADANFNYMQRELKTRKDVQLIEFAGDLA